MEKKIEGAIQAVYAKDPDAWNALGAKLQKALADGEAQLQAAEKAMKDHAAECKAKNPETFAKIESIITECQTKLNEALASFKEATETLTKDASNISAQVVADVSLKYADCAVKLKDGKKSFDSAVSEAKKEFPEMYDDAKTEASAAVAEASTKLADAQSQVEAAVEAAT
jgi:uncharacterized phage infection (PIP) family protein YhgE